MNTFFDGKDIVKQILKRCVVCTSFILMPFEALIAHNLEVKTFKVVPNDLSASVNPRFDLNGNHCALVKVVMQEKLAKIEGNVIGEVATFGSENWVYVSEGTKELKLIPSSSLSKTIRFADFDIPFLESKRTYVLELTNNQGKSSVESANSTLLIHYTPKSATVLVDSKLYRGNGTIALSLPMGSYDYVIAEEGYDTAEGTVKLKKGANNQLDINLQKNLTTDNSAGGQITNPNQSNINTYVSNNYGLTKPKVIKGTVYDKKTHEPIIGASIMTSKRIKGKIPMATITDIDGQFSLEVPAHTKFLYVSYVGLKEETVKLNDSMDDNIVVYMKK